MIQDAAEYTPARPKPHAQTLSIALPLEKLVFTGNDRTFCRSVLARFLGTLIGG